MTDRFVKCEWMDDTITNHGRLMGVEIRHLAALEAVVETGSFGRAGAELGYSQSAISQQIATLERAAGLQLLERPGGRRPVTPTDAGQRLLRHARRASAAMRAAEADLRALADGEAGTLRVGTFQSVGVRLLPSAMRRYVDRWPNVEVRLIEAGYDEELHGLLERGELDLAFIVENDDPAFERIRVISDPYVLLAPADRRARAERPADSAARDRPPTADRLSQCLRGRRAVPALPRARARDRLPLRRGWDRPGPRRRGHRLHGRAAARSRREPRRRRARGGRHPTAGDHDRVAHRPHPDAGGARVRRHRHRARGRDRGGLRSGRDEPHHATREATPMKVLTVVGNRPQFIKSAPALGGAPRGRDRRGRRAHGPALGPGRCRRSSTRSSRSPSLRRARSPHLGRRDARGRARGRVVADVRPGLACWSTATRTRRSRAAGRPTGSPSRTSRPACGAAT